MKMLTILFLFLLVSPAFGQLTEEDLQTLKEELRIIVKEEIALSEKHTEKYIDLKIDAVNNKIDELEKSLNSRIDATNARTDAIDLKIDTVNNKIDAVEKSLNSRIDATNAQINAAEKSVKAPIDVTNSRIGGTNTRINAVEKNLNALTNATNTQINALNMRIQDVNSHFYYLWIVIAALIGVLGFPRLVVYVNRVTRAGEPW